MFPVIAIKAFWVCGKGGGVEEYFHLFLTSALKGDRKSTSLPERFTPRKETQY
jgi:hypothetical protein